jgi:hypothetical protein
MIDIQKLQSMRENGIDTNDNKTFTLEEDRPSFLGAPVIHQILYILRHSSL